MVRLGKSFIAVLVVPGDASHELLRLVCRKSGNLRQEIYRVAAAKRGRRPSKMQDLN